MLDHSVGRTGCSSCLDTYFYDAADDCRGCLRERDTVCEVSDTLQPDFIVHRRFDSCCYASREIACCKRIGSGRRCLGLYGGETGQ